MEQATQRELTKNRSGDEGVQFKRKTFHRKPVFWVTAILLGIVLAMVTILLVYVARGFASEPELPESMEGEATFTSDEGEREEFHFIIDYKKKLVQISSRDKMALPSFKGKSSANGMATTTTKIVVQDYNMGRIYFILPGNGQSSTKCTYTALQGDMIPRNLLKHATLKSEKSEGNTSHIHLQVDNETEVDVYKAEGHNGKIYEVYLHLPNGTIHMHSKEKGANFTDYKQINCYKYDEDNTRIEKTFYDSIKSKLKLSNETTPFSNDSLSQNLRETAKRRRRGIGWRDGWLDWWYGNWCGYRQGGYQNKPKPSCKYFCRNSTGSISPACRNCLPPKDALDEACMEHDRCANELGSGPLWCQPIGNACECDRPFVRRVYNLTQNCSTTSCRSHALQIHLAFKLLSCWYRKRTCFPVIRTKCRCPWCLCPRIRISTKCVVLKRCAFFGSGKV